jgi:PPM family protein phosphatase
VKFGVKSDKGRKREKNEDSCNILAGYPGVPVTFIIADGMGGHNYGEIASRMAVDNISSLILQFPGIFIDEDNISVAICDIIRKTNSEIYREASGTEEYSGMGTTLTIGTVINKKLYIEHVGDSRFYLFREGNLKQLTSDHSYVEELLKSGSITMEEALNHPKRNVLTRALGCMETIDIDSVEHDMLDNDIYLLCTDGLTNLLGEDEIKAVIENGMDLEYMCDELVQKANEKGGNDNITVILFKA